MLLLTLACTGTPDDSASLVQDETLEYPAPEAGGMQFAPPNYTVPAYTETIHCWFDTYAGDNVGVVGGDFYQAGDYGHHVIVSKTNAHPNDYPDGEAVDCYESSDLMVDQEAFIFASVKTAPGHTELVLPEGMGVKLKDGERVIIESHHINPTDTDILVNDAINLEVVPEDEIETWVGVYVNNLDSFSILPNQDATEEMACVVEEEELNFLNIVGHLHEWGSAFKLELETEEGSELLYEVPEWDPYYRDDPPITTFEPGEFSVSAGDTFHTTCSWSNDTDHTLEFPEEMCVFVGFVYPTVVPIVCSQ